MSERLHPCADRQLALHALLDGELDALAAQAVEEHARGCAGCRAELERIETLRALLSERSLRYTPPQGVGERILARTGVPGRSPEAHRLSAMPWLGGGVIGALAASLALFLAVPDIAEPGLGDALVDGHIRALQGGHLLDVPTSDRHTVKPWFNGRLTYAPPVVDLKPQGFPLIGGRLDVVARENVAVLVYKRRLHTINLTIRPAPALASPLAGETRRAGYNLVRWTQGGLEFWAVSDLDVGELRDFREAMIVAIAQS